MVNYNTRSVIALSVLHFFVDFQCAMLIYSNLKGRSAEEIIICTVIYNGLAFAFQILFGAVADRFDITRLFTVFGPFLVCTGGLFGNIVMVSLIAGIGNGLFHIGAGRETLIRSDKKAKLIGMFVAPGALGIFLGPVLYRYSFIYRIITPLVLLSFCVFYIFRIKVVKNTSVGKAGKIPDDHDRGRSFLILISMFLTVFFRQFIGTLFDYEFRSVFVLSLFFTLFIVLGKFFGGILSDRFDTVIFYLVTQILSTVLLVFSLYIEYFAFIGIFLFNLTMAISATLLYRTYPEYPGTMFGVTTLAIYLGVLPSLLHKNIFVMNKVAISLFCILSVITLVSGLILGKDKK